MKMRTRLLILTVISALIITWGVDSAYALSCGSPLFTESYERHDLLLHGKLVEKEILFPVWENQRLTTLTFDTINVYKGEIDKIFTIKANLFWDDYYVQGEEYVLFADKGENGYFRDTCVPDYVASPSIIKFLNEYSTEHLVQSDVTSLYDIVQGFERDDLDLKVNKYANQNREDAASLVYVVETSDYALAWFGALQIMISGIIIGIVFVIWRKRK